MSFDAFMETAWNDHGDRPQEVADRLAGSLQVIAAAEHIPPFARLLTHVYGEHLGQWRQGIALLESLRSLTAFDGSPSVTGALARAFLRCASEARGRWNRSQSNRVSVLARSSALAARGGSRRALPHTRALQLADSVSIHWLASDTCARDQRNNLASSLGSRRIALPRNGGMIVAAEAEILEASRDVARRRAEYRLARSLLLTGGPTLPLSARRCIGSARRTARGLPSSFRVRRSCAGAACRVGCRQLHGLRRHARRLYELVPADSGNGESDLEAHARW